MSKSTRRLAAVMTVVGLLALPGAAQAALPATHNHTIVPNSSIGGVKLGQAQAQAKAAWGARGASCRRPSAVTTICEYKGRSDLGTAVLIFLRGKVHRVQIGVGSNSRSHALNYSTPLAAFKTSKGIRLGSSLAAVKQAYPALLLLRPTSAHSYALFGAGGTQTLLAFSASKLRSFSVIAA